MLNYEEELNKFKPGLVVDVVVFAIYSGYLRFVI